MQAKTKFPSLLLSLPWTLTTTSTILVFLGSSSWLSSVGHAWMIPSYRPLQQLRVTTIINSLTRRGNPEDVWLDADFETVQVDISHHTNDDDDDDDRIGRKKNGKEEDKTYKQILALNETVSALSQVVSSLSLNLSAALNEVSQLENQLSALEAKISISTSIHQTHPLAMIPPRPPGSKVKPRPPEYIQPPTGKNEQLFEYLKWACIEWETNPNKIDLTVFLAQIRQAVQSLLESGASVTNSHGLHVACMNNCFPVVELLLQLEPVAVNGYERYGCTPLMVAANCAALRCNRDGIQDTRVLQYLLMHGADKSLEDRNGLTAYRHFEKQRLEMGRPVTPAGETLVTPSERAVQMMLLPNYDGLMP